MTALAIVVVAHDSEPELNATLDAVVAQLGPDDELVVVDCGSATAPAVAAPARVVDAGANLGFAGGAVRGAAATGAPLLLFLNPDATPQPGCLDALREAPAAWAAWQALVLLPDGAVNTSGNLVHWTGIGWAADAPPPPAPAEVGFASGAALVVRREDFDAVGGFEPDYFMYGEDLDLCLRLRLAGRGVGIVPGAVVTHGYSFHKGDYKWFHLERNRWWTVLAVYPLPLLVVMLPVLLALEPVLLAVAWRGGWLRAKLRAQAAVVRTLPAALRRRRVVQRGRRTGARAFASGFTTALPRAR